MTEETRVGFMETAILEEICLDYIKTFTIEGRFEGDVKYLDLYKKLVDYNEQE